MTPTLPGVETAIQVAAHDSYSAVLVVIVLVVLLSAGLLMGRWFIHSTEKRLEDAAVENAKRLAEASEREGRMAERINTLETYIQTTLTSMMRDMGTMMGQNIAASKQLCDAVNDLRDALISRPCLLDGHTQAELTQAAKTEVRASMRNDPKPDSK